MYIYPQGRASDSGNSGSKDGTSKGGSRRKRRRPPISLLAMSVGNNVFVDPSREELSVAEGCWVVTVDCSGFSSSSSSSSTTAATTITDTSQQSSQQSFPSKNTLKVLGLRTLESFSSPTVPLTPLTGGTTTDVHSHSSEAGVVGGRGGINIKILRKVVSIVGKVAPEVWEALEGIIERDRRG